MKMLHIHKALLTLSVSVLAIAVTTTAKAQLICNNWSAGGSTSGSVYNCNFSTGSSGGTYGNSYNCFDNTRNNDCTISYTGGNCYHGSCTVVFTCLGGQTYSCNVNNWDGTETIDCDNIPQYCKDIDVCTPSRAPVPEPSTVLAGALLLIPLGVSSARKFCTHKAAGNI